MYSAEQIAPRPGTALKRPYEIDQRHRIWTEGEIIAARIETGDPVAIKCCAPISRQRRGDGAVYARKPPACKILTRRS